MKYNFLLIIYINCQCVKLDLKMQKHLDGNANHVNHVKLVDRCPDVWHMVAKLKNVFFYKNEGLPLLMNPSFPI